MIILKCYQDTDSGSWSIIIVCYYFQFQSKDKITKYIQKMFLIEVWYNIFIKRGNDDNFICEFIIFPIGNYKIFPLHNLI